MRSGARPRTGAVQFFSPLLIIMLHFEAATIIIISAHVVDNEQTLLIKKQWRYCVFFLIKTARIK